MRIRSVLTRWGIVAGLMALPLATFPAETSTTSEASSQEPTKSSEAHGIKVGNLDIVQGKIMGVPAEQQEATLENVLKHWDKLDINVALSPGTAKIKIGDLKLRNANLVDALQALMVAGGMKFSYHIVGSEGANSPLLVSFMARAQPKRNVEVFNLTPYFRAAGISEGETEDAKLVNQALDRIKKITVETIVALHENQPNSVEDNLPSFNFHKGANLLVVTGTEEAIDVARKILNALVQQKPSGPEVRR